MLKAAFLVVVILSSVLICCEETAHLVVENQTSIDVTIVHEGIKKDGTQINPKVLDTVQAGQTVKLGRSLHLRRNVIGDIVILRAENPSGDTVWSKEWTYDEFKELESTKWKITIKSQ